MCSSMGSRSSGKYSGRESDRTASSILSVAAGSLSLKRPGRTTATTSSLGSIGLRLAGEVKVTREPLRRQSGDVFQFARLLEEMTRSGNDDQLLDGGAEPIQCLLIQPDHHFIIAADNEQ